MAVGYSPSSIIGGPLEPRVLAQLKARESLYKKRDGRNNNELLYLNSKTGWVKLSSSVNVLDPDVNESSNAREKAGDYTLAKNNVLFGGTFKEGSTKPKSGIHGIDTLPSKVDAAYKRYDTIGFRPMPGINEFNIRAKNRFGTLREADVTFQVWSVEQLTEFESLYLRPGFTVLLEWGHSLYIENPKESNKNKAQVKMRAPKTVTNYFSSTAPTKNELQDEIKKLKAKSDHNYDAVFGYIKNFSWSYRPDGGYDCKLSIISAGELIESVKISVSPGEIGLETEGTVVNNDSTKTPLHAFLTGIHQVNIPKPEDPNNWYVDQYEFSNKVDTVLNGPKTQGLYNAFKKLTGNDQLRVLAFPLNSLQSQTADGEVVSGKDGFRYILMRDFLALVNCSFLLDTGRIKDDNPEKLFDFSLDAEKQLFYTFTDHLAIDPGIAVLPKSPNKPEARLKYLITDRIYIDPVCTTQTNADGTTVVEKTDESILNISLNIDFILDKLDSINSKKEEDRTVLAFIEAILDELTITLGNINDFGLHYEEDEYRFYIVDRKLMPNSSHLSKSIINLTGLKATVTNISLSSRLSPNIAKMIAVSAQAAGTDVGEDTENLFRWNKGLVDRIVTSRTVPQVGTKDESPEGKKKKVLKIAAAVGGQVANFNATKRYDPEIYSSLINSHKELMTYLSIRYNKQDVRNGAPGIIPFDLDLTLDGIGGIKIGQAFTINEGILPKKYDGMVAFIVTGMSHAVANNKWNTMIKGQTIIIGKGDALPDSEQYETISEDILQDVLKTGRIPGIPGETIKFYGTATDNGVLIRPDLNREITKDELLRGFINKNPLIQAQFSKWLDLLIEGDYGGYKMELTAAQRNIETSIALYRNGEGPGAFPGKSSHNYAAGLDVNIILPNGTTRLIKADSPELWEVTGIPQLAQQAGLYWAGRERLGDGQYDTVHFMSRAFNYKETYKEIVNYLVVYTDSIRNLTDAERKEITEGAAYRRQVSGRTIQKALINVLSNPLTFGAYSTEKGQRLVPQGSTASSPSLSQSQIHEILDRSQRGERLNSGDYITLARERSGGGFQ